MTLALRTGVSCAETDYGLVLLDEDSGDYWNLNPTGALVLRTLLAGGSCEQAARALTGEYEVPEAEARRDAEELAAALRASGLVDTGGTDGGRRR